MRTFVAMLTVAMCVARVHLGGHFFPASKLNLIVVVHPESVVAFLGYSQRYSGALVA